MLNSFLRSTVMTAFVLAVIIRVTVSAQSLCVGNSAILTPVVRSFSGIPHKRQSEQGARAEILQRLRNDHSQGYGQPAGFIENRGQWDAQVRFLMQGNNIDTWITERGVRYDLFQMLPAPIPLRRNEHSIVSESGDAAIAQRSGHVIGITFEDASFAPRAQGITQLPGMVNYFIGNDRSQWASGVRLFQEAQLEELYAGIDAVFYMENGTPRYDLVVAPGADPSQVSMRIEGSNEVSIGTDGALQIATTVGTLHQDGLFAYQSIGGARQQVECRFVLDKNQRVRFALGEYDHNRELVIDPLVYSTYLGGNGYEYSHGIAVDREDNAYIVGRTTSTDFPTLNEYQDNLKGEDVFITKLTYHDSIAVAFSTYLGGDGSDNGFGIAVDPHGDIYIAGTTISSDFPRVREYPLTTSDGGAFIAKLSYTDKGSASLVYSTCLGGNSTDVASGIAVDTLGNAYVVGSTYSSNFPTVHQYQAYRGVQDVFVAKLADNGGDNVELAYSTYIGSSRVDLGNAIAVDQHGDVYIAGMTYYKDFPAMHPYQGTQGNGDVFVAKLSQQESGDLELIFSTCLGGSGIDQGMGIAVDDEDNVYVTGVTSSLDFPVVNSYQRAQGGDDAFVAKLVWAESGSITLAYSTYLGGRESDNGRAIAVDADGNAYITGETLSPDFPTSDTAQNFREAYDVFITMLSFSGSGSVIPEYSMCIGGTDGDGGRGIAVDNSGAAYITGYTNSTDFPTLTPLQHDQPDFDAFVLKIPPASVSVTELQDFTVTAETGAFTLAWHTAREVNNRGFEVQRSIEGDTTSFTTIATYVTDSTLAGLGTSATGKEYRYVDNSPNLQHGTTYCYRLVDITGDNVRTMHPAQCMTLVTSSVEMIDLFSGSISPNPSSGILRIDYSLSSANTVSILIYTVEGQLVDKQLSGQRREAGHHSEHISTDKLQPGAYFVKVLAGRDTFVTRFVEMR